MKKLSRDLRNDTHKITEVNEHVLIFHPPVMIQNMLPISIEATITDQPSSPVEQSQNLAIAPSESVPVYDFDFSHVLKLHVRAGRGNALVSQTPATIVPVASRYVAEISGQLLCVPSKEIDLENTNGEPLPGGHRLRGRTLRLRLHHKVMGESGARCITLFSPYWIVNKTDMPLELRDANARTFQPVCTPVIAAPVACDGEGIANSQPVLFSSSKGSMCVGITTRQWSKAVNLDSVGIMVSVRLSCCCCCCCCCP